MRLPAFRRLPGFDAGAALFRLACLLLLGECGVLQAQDPSVEVVRGRRFVQSTAGSPIAAAGDQAFYFLAQAVGLEALEPISTAQVTPPAGGSQPLTRAGAGVYQLWKSFTSDTARDAAFPTGRYGFSATVSLLGSTQAHAILDASPAPGVPHLSNFTDAQNVDSDNDFTLRWDSFAGAGSDDAILLQILDATNGSIVEEFTDLSGDTKEWTFSGGELPKGKTLQVRLAFIHRSTASDLEGAELLSGRSVSISETTASLKTTGTSTTPTDTTPPQLSSVIPSIGATLQNAVDPVAFQFSEPMNPANVSIAWSATLNGLTIPLASSAFQTAWNDAKDTLVVLYNTSGGGWPAGATVAWTLNARPGAAGNFTDTAGNELAVKIGGFTTAGGVDPCTSPSNPGELPGSAFFLSKQVNYRQTSADAPAQDPDLGASAFAFMDLPGTSLGTGVVTLKVPTSTPFVFKLKVLDPIINVGDASRRFFVEKFASRADLDDAYPAGSYALELRNSGVTVTNTVSLQVTATGYPPIPHYSNFAATQSVEATRDATVAWDPYAGSSTNSEFISLNVYAPDGTLVFRAPDPCHNRTLAPDASGVVIPANTLTNGVSYTAELSFSHLTDHDKTLTGVPGTGLASLSRITRLTLKTGAGAVTAPAPTLNRIAFTAPSSLVLELAFTPGQPFTVESAPALGGTFQPLLTTNPPVSPVILTLPTSADSAFFRFRTP